MTFHLVTPDPAFSSVITGAPIVPAGTPLTESAVPVPGTGPYMIDRYQAGREVHLVRNPRFEEWSNDAQPDGYPDAIDWTASSLADPSSLVESGTADVVLYGSFSAARLDQLRTRVPAQLHVGPSQETWFEMMNTRIPPFNDPRVRQAVDYAADRQALVDAWGGPLAARVTCQVIPPEYTGYEPYCPYTVDPNVNGSWLGPDLPKAKALIEQAGVKGQRVTVWGWPMAQHPRWRAISRPCSTSSGSRRRRGCSRSASTSHSWRRPPTRCRWPVLDPVFDAVGFGHDRRDVHVPWFLQHVPLLRVSDRLLQPPTRRRHGKGRSTRGERSSGREPAVGAD